MRLTIAVLNKMWSADTPWADMAGRKVTNDDIKLAVLRRSEKMLENAQGAFAMSKTARGVWKVGLLHIKDLGDMAKKNPQLLGADVTLTEREEFRAAFEQWNSERIRRLEQASGK